MDQDTKKLLKRLGKNLHTLRINKGVSLEELSKQVEISRNLIYKMEKGVYNLWLWQLWTLATYFGETPADLLRKKYWGGTGNKPGR